MAFRSCSTLQIFSTLIFPSIYAEIIFSHHHHLLISSLRQGWKRILESHGRLHSGRSMYFNHMRSATKPNIFFVYFDNPLLMMSKIFFLFTQYHQLEHHYMILVQPYNIVFSIGTAWNHQTPEQFRPPFKPYHNVRFLCNHLGWVWRDRTKNDFLGSNFLWRICRKSDRYPTAWSLRLWLSCCEIYVSINLTRFDLSRSKGVKPSFSTCSSVFEAVSPNPVSS